MSLSSLPFREVPDMNGGYSTYMVLQYLYQDVYTQYMYCSSTHRYTYAPKNWLLGTGLPDGHILYHYERFGLCLSCKSIMVYFSF